MSLLSRLTQPAAGEVKIPVHSFMAALAELKRDAPGVSVASISAFPDFNLDVGEQASLQTFVDNFLGDIITREQVHDVLMLGEVSFYTVQQCSDRLFTPGTTNVLPRIVQRQLEIIARSVNDYLIVGCAVTAQGTPDMTLAVAKGSVFTNGTLRAIPAGNVNISVADATKPRIDLVVIDASGNKQVRAGTASPNPDPPALSANDVALAFVYVPAADTAIGSGQLSNARVQTSSGPVLIGKRGTALVINNNSTAQDYISLVLPSGLLIGGRIVRVRCGGTMLLNSGTPTVRLAISFGGTTMFNDITAAATADADRLAWTLQFDLIGQGGSDQALNGQFSLSPIAAKTAPTAGVGDIGNAAATSVAINGASAVDADAADRTLLLQFTMSVANAANEIAMEFASAELL